MSTTTPSLLVILLLTLMLFVSIRSVSSWSSSLLLSKTTNRRVLLRRPSLFCSTTTTRTKVQQAAFHNHNNHSAYTNSSSSLRHGSDSADIVHVVIQGNEYPTVQDTIASHIPPGWRSNDNNSDTEEEVLLPQNNNRTLSPRQLLQLGSVWFLNASAHRDQKPTRLSLDDADSVLQEQDYLRIHYQPRRFLNVYEYNFTSWKNNDTDDGKGLIVAKGPGFWVIDKPEQVPVHPTVDNGLENVVEQIRCFDPGYVSPPQRLDQNTSGLFVVARSKPFAGYFAKLLRHKTTDELLPSTTSTTTEPTIQKGYKCLLCLIPRNNTSLAQSYQTLLSYDILTHYLEPSIRAPKHFSRTQFNTTWLEARMRVTRVGDVVPLWGSSAAERLREKLFSAGTIPKGCVGVAPVTVELLTGRTHQIRGQFAAEGYPLVGDVPYGGAIPTEDENNDERLALQCSSLKFLDPDVVVLENGDEDWKPSNRWNEYQLDRTWWDPLLREYQEAAANDGDATTSMEDITRKDNRDTAPPAKKTKIQNYDPNLLPPRVSLSPGANKYVLVQAKDVDSNVLWFVKSASPQECGGPYHANVAQDLVEWLQAVEGLTDVRVTGGGRIDYDAQTNYAKVYGFSYGFGKGNHAKAARLIERYTDILATHDNDPALY